ncbi:polysaccharide deacetylase family protein [Streptosporangium amethystogenes subsp. fukuiense]|uniref:Polysaccharide deacetylase family protein n=1 Tax=Streptosporangium amethystogenes subsp. fukuiense TaxID=698418 RepID=A0ABW2T8Z8_9ACTN
MIGPATARALRSSAPGWPLVLYFHHVHPELVHYTSLTPDDFERGLETVLSRYGPALPPEALDDLTALPDEPTVLVTLDDGHRDNLDHALPILDRLGIRAVFFAITEMAELEAQHARHLSWAELTDLHRAGHAVGSHTVTHRMLHQLAPVEQRREIADSLAAIQARLGAVRPLLAYPYGFPPTVDAVPAGTLGFGTVKADPLPWTVAPQRIRRTYLPSDDQHAWPWLCDEWRRQWNRESQ